MRNEKIIQLISECISVDKYQVINVLKLFDEGSTVPFVARYRKEMTGSLDEVFLLRIKEEDERLTELEKRKLAILKSIGEQDCLTPDLLTRIEECYQLNDLEDLYLPFKPKRKTRASIAREKGLPIF